MCKITPKIVTICVIMILSVYLLHCYFNTSINFPDPNREGVLRVPGSSCIQEWEGNLQENVNLQFEPANQIENQYIGKLRIELIVHDNKSVMLPEARITMHAENIKTVDVSLNGERLNISKKLAENCFQPTGYNVDTGESYRQCENTPHYVLPSLKLMGDEKTNNLDIEIVFNKITQETENISVPLFFKNETYSRFLSLPKIFPCYLYSKQYPNIQSSTTFTLGQTGYYDIVNSESGWMTRYYVDRNGEYGNYTTFSKATPQQEKNTSGTIFSSELEINKDNAPEAFRILLIPDKKIFLLPLLFLWMPILVDLWETKKKPLGKMLQTYIGIGLIVGVTTFAGLTNLNIINSVLYFYELYFVLVVAVFPIIYLFVFHNKVTKIKKTTSEEKTPMSN